MKTSIYLTERSEAVRNKKSTSDQKKFCVHARQDRIRETAENVNDLLRSAQKALNQTVVDGSQGELGSR